MNNQSELIGLIESAIHKALIVDQVPVGFDAAKQVLSAITGAGLSVVPNEPDEKIRESIREAASVFGGETHWVPDDERVTAIYQAGLTASPIQDKGE